MNLMSPIRLPAAIAGALLAAADPAAGQCEPELLDKLFAPDPEVEQVFGRSVDIRDGVAVIGAYADDDKGTNAGAAYIFREVQGVWTVEAKLTASDGASADFFGSSVSIHGSAAVVGAPYDDNAHGQNAGSIYVFRYDGQTWKQETKLTGEGTTTDSLLGGSVSLSMTAEGEVVAAGAPASLPSENGFGAVYVYRHGGNGWAQEAALTSADQEKWDDFGRFVALDGNRIVAGAPRQIGVGYASGAAYVFRRVDATWAKEAKLVPEDTFGHQWFGAAVDLDGDSALVGTWSWGVGCEECPGPGAAYVFRWAEPSWSEEAKLVPSDGKDVDFGVAVALQGALAVVAGIDGQGAYFYERGLGGLWLETFHLPVPEHAANWGISIALRDDRLIVGAPYDSTFGHLSGAVYTYTACPAEGCYADLDGSGTLDLFDFLAFVNLFNGANDTADCDGSGEIDLFDFLCFVNAFSDGCG